MFLLQIYTKEIKVISKVEKWWIQDHYKQKMTEVWIICTI